MHRPAFAVIDVTLLWTGPPQRGADLVIPGRAGVLSMPRRAQARQVSLPMVIDARFAVDDDPIDEPGDGDAELANRHALLDWLGLNVSDPTYTGDGTRTATLTGTGTNLDRAGPVTVEGITPGRTMRGLMVATLDLTLPAGVLPVVEP